MQNDSSSPQAPAGRHTAALVLFSGGPDSTTCLAQALSLYERFGFEPEGLRPRYYAETAEDAIIMWVHGIDTDEYRQRIDRIVAALSA